MAYKVETTDSRETARFGVAHYQVTEQWACLNSAATGVGNGLWNRTAQGYTGPWAPRCRWYRIRRNWMPCLSLITARFKTLRKPGVARIRVMGDAVGRRIVKDRDGKMVSGFDLDAYRKSPKDVWEWVVVKGNPVELEPRSVIVIETAFQNYPLASIEAKIGKTNSNYMTKLGMGPGTLRLLRAPGTTTWEEDDFWYADFAFAVNLQGWNNSVEVQKHTQCAVSIPRVNEDGELIEDSYSRVSKLLPVTVKDGVMAKTQREKRKVYGETSFSKLNAWIRW